MKSNPKKGSIIFIINPLFIIIIIIFFSDFNSESNASTLNNFY